LFVAGGHISNSVGLPTAALYDAIANSRTRLPYVNAGGWYSVFNKQDIKRSGGD
jgi:hypothetical protein